MATLLASGPSCSKIAAKRQPTAHRPLHDVVGLPLAVLSASLVLATGCGVNAVNTAHATPRVLLASSDDARPEPGARSSTAPNEVSDALGFTIMASHHHAVMLGMRLSEVWLWPDPFADTNLTRVSRRHRDAFSRPPKWRTDARWFEWDGDRWWINVVGHALFGSELYLAARRCQFGPVTAVASTAVSSALWEYGYEASGVRPSALDLVYTPLAGLALGEFRHWAYQRVDSLSRGPVKALVQVIVDPLGTLERAFGAPC